MYVHFYVYLLSLLVYGNLFVFNLVFAYAYLLFLIYYYCCVYFIFKFILIVYLILFTCVCRFCVFLFTLLCMCVFVFGLLLILICLFCCLPVYVYFGSLHVFINFCWLVIVHPLFCLIWFHVVLCSFLYSTSKTQFTVYVCWWDNDLFSYYVVAGVVIMSPAIILLWPPFCLFVF